MSEDNGGSPRHKICSINVMGRHCIGSEGTDRGGAAAVPTGLGTSSTSARELAHMHRENAQNDSITFDREGVHHAT
jgi:hypothetical protein